MNTVLNNRKRQFQSQWSLVLLSLISIFIVYCILWHKSPSQPNTLGVAVAHADASETSNIRKSLSLAHSITQPSLSESDSLSKRDQIMHKLIWALRPENRKITLVINSCGRLDLLNQTISSFMEFYPHNKYPLHEKIIIDDCRTSEKAHELIDAYYPEFQIILTADNDYENDFVHRDERITNAMDKLFKQVVTPWIYHLEDDWIFTRQGFIEESFDIFEASLPPAHQTGGQWKDSQDGAVNDNTFPELYRDADHNRSRMEHYFFDPSSLYSVVLCWNMYRQKLWCNRTYLYEYKGSQWYNMNYHLKRGVTWGGYSFNSGLQATFLYQMYGDFLSPDGEWGRSEKMIKDGFKVALMAPPACDHIGADRHVGVVGNLN